MDEGRVVAREEGDDAGHVVGLCEDVAAGVLARALANGGRFAEVFAEELHAPVAATSTSRIAADTRYIQNMAGRLESVPVISPCMSASANAGTVLARTSL